jgi:hypothetical protein
MSAERVPRHGKADVAFAGAQLGDAWLLILSIFGALVLGSVFGWAAYIGVPLAGYFLTKTYIQWKSKNLPGHFQVLLYRVGIMGFSSAFNRRKKLFIGDSKIVNPSALQMGAVIRADAPPAGGKPAPSMMLDDLPTIVQDDSPELVD